MGLFNRQFGARLLNRMRFRTKLMLLPIMAAVGFVIVLAASTFFAMRNQNLLTRVESGTWRPTDRAEAAGRAESG